MSVVALVSGGLSSVEALERAIDIFGKDGVIPVFADVGQVVENGKVVCGEDEDLLRFLAEVEEFLGIKVNRIKHQKYSNIWDCFFGERFIGNNQLDTCSKFLKREVVIKWTKQFVNALHVVGFSWMERDRVQKFKTFNQHSWFPLCEKPFVTNDDIAKKWEARGVKRSRSYDEGFSHDNCGGFCVKMGLGQAYDLWKLRPHRYEYAERREKEFREKINPSVTIFKKSEERITMAELRKLFESGYVPRTSKTESCGGRCMLPSDDLMDDPMF